MQAQQFAGCTKLELEGTIDPFASQKLPKMMGRHANPAAVTTAQQYAISIALIDRTQALGGQRNIQYQTGHGGTYANECDNIATGNHKTR